MTRSMLGKSGSGSSKFASRLATGVKASVLAAILCVAQQGSSVSSASAAATPAWRIESVANPTVFSSRDNTECEGGCDKYELLLTNVGGAPLGEEDVTVTDTLPTGITTSSIRQGDEEERWQCTNGEGQQVVTCTISAELLHLLHPGASEALSQAPALSVYVQVEAGVPPGSTRTGLVTASGGGAPSASTVQTAVIGPAALSFGVSAFSSHLADLGGAPDTQAADHPNSLTTSLDVTSSANYPKGGRVNPTLPTEDVKDIVVDLPPGFVGNPQVMPQCTLHDLVVTSESSGCPAASQVGRVSINGQGSYSGEYYFNGRQNIPIYNMIPEHGYPAEFGFLFAGYPIAMEAGVVGSGGETHLRVTIPGVPAAETLGFQGAEVTFFGNPQTQDGGAAPGAAFFTNPSFCSGQPPTMTLHADSWQNPGRKGADGTPDFSDSAWRSASTTTAPAVDGCEALIFNPTLSLRPTDTEAASAAGYTVDLHVPQQNIADTASLASPDLRKAVVALPEGVAVNPSAASGLGACAPAQIGLQDNSPPSCPDASKIGAVEVNTPLLAEALGGDVYLATPNDNPFNSLLAIYVVVENPNRGVVVKLPGKVDADPVTGRLTATFDDNPQLPFENVQAEARQRPTGAARQPEHLRDLYDEHRVDTLVGAAVGSACHAFEQFHH